MYTTVAFKPTSSSPSALFNSHLIHKITENSGRLIIIERRKPNLRMYLQCTFALFSSVMPKCYVSAKIK